MKKISSLGHVAISTGVIWLMFGCWYVLRASAGMLTYVWLTGLLAGALLLFREIHWFSGKLLHRTWALTIYVNLLLTLISTMLTLIVFEGYLQMNRQSSAQPLTLPDAWKGQPVQIEGARSAMSWHGKLHVYNEDGMRRTTPFPPRQPEICRIMVIGDSLTYGKGVALEDTYPSLLQAQLAAEFRVEVLNLGVSGLQSEDLFSILTNFAPRLQPDLIVYGVCLNDFLASGEGQESRAKLAAWAFPLPNRWKEFLRQHTRAGEFFDTRYHDLLMRLGLRADFLNNILHDLHHYQIRFTRDVTAMNYFVVSNGLPPVVAMVLDQYPEYEGRGQRVARLAESILSLVGMAVVPTDAYYKTYDGHKMGVSPWEGHPNEEAHRLFAEHLANFLRAHPVLQKYRK